MKYELKTIQTVDLRTTGIPKGWEPFAATDHRIILRRRRRWWHRPKTT